MRSDDIHTQATYIEWKKIYKKYGHTPATYLSIHNALKRVIYALTYWKFRYQSGYIQVQRMPTTRQKNKELVESFPKEYRLYFDLQRGGDVNQPMNEVGRVMAKKFDREPVWRW